MRFTAILCVCLLHFSTAFLRAEEEKPGEGSLLKIRQWVEELGSADDEIQRQAEAGLAQAGDNAVAALEAAKASTSPRVQASVAHLLNLQQCRTQPLNYLDVVPSGGFTFRVRNIEELIQRMQKTTIAKMLGCDALAGRRLVFLKRFQEYSAAFAEKRIP